MAGVARVPVVVASVAVEQGISAAAHAFDDTGTRRNSGHVLARDCRGSTQTLELCFESSRMVVAVVGGQSRLTHEAVLQGV